jgi:hypothetical protein
MVDPATVPPPAVSFDALAELISKPNLFSPLHRNAKLPVRPFLRPGQSVPAREMRAAAGALLAAFSEGDFAGYLEYRLGDAKAAQIRAALQAICGVAEQAEAVGARMAFMTVMKVQTEA